MFHPDRGGDEDIMKAVNSEYERIIKEQLFAFTSENEKKHFDEDYEMLYPELIRQLLNLRDITIEIVGNWVWVSGATKQHKETLKALKLRWAPKKLMWYFRPEKYKKRYRSKPLSMDAIRASYGSTIVEGEEQRRLATA